MYINKPYGIISVKLRMLSTIRKKTQKQQKYKHLSNYLFRRDKIYTALSFNPYFRFSFAIYIG